MACSSTGADCGLDRVAVPGSLALSARNQPLSARSSTDGWDTEVSRALPGESLGVGALVM